MSGTKSKQIALFAAHVYSVTYVLCIMSSSTKQTFRIKTGPKLSILAVKNGHKSLNLSGVKGGDGGYL